MVSLVNRHCIWLANVYARSDRGGDVQELRTLFQSLRQLVICSNKVCRKVGIGIICRN